MQVAMAIEFRDVWLEKIEVIKRYPVRLRQLFIESYRYWMLQRRNRILECRQVTVLSTFKAVCQDGVLFG